MHDSQHDGLVPPANDEDVHHVIPASTRRRARLDGCRRVQSKRDVTMPSGPAGAEGADAPYRLHEHALVGGGTAMHDETYQAHAVAADKVQPAHNHQQIEAWRSTLRTQVCPRERFPHAGHFGRHRRARNVLCESLSGGP